jgi:hypothetical protein
MKGKIVMRIEMDAAVREYVVRVLASILYGPQASVKFDDNNARLQERAVMRVLEGMVASGVAEHKYDDAREVDEFNSTDQLIRNWSWTFPGDVYRIDHSERQTLKLHGKRSRYFNERWLAQDRRDPVRGWSN